MNGGRMKAKGRTNRNQAVGSRLVAQYAASGYTQREFCARHRLAVGTLQYWLRKVVAGEGGQRPAEAQLVEVSLVKSAADSQTGWAAKGGGSYEVVLADERRLRIPSGFDLEEVGVLLALLEGRAC